MTNAETAMNTQPTRIWKVFPNTGLKLLETTKSMYQPMANTTTERAVILMTLCFLSLLILLELAIINYKLSNEISL